MVKEIERYGIPIVHMATITTICQSVGANRIVPTIAIPYPIGNPKVSHQDEESIRHELVDRALMSLVTDISDQTIF